MDRQLQKRTYEIDKPFQMIKMANVLKDYVIKHKLYVNIVGKNYVMVEGWQFAGGMMGLFPRVIKVENIGANKWLAQVEIINKKTNEVMSSGFAICSKEENKKKTFDEYAILSMAQTRAIGKAYRNLIGWVMKMAGYESTPAEEMKKGDTPESTVTGAKVKISQEVADNLMMKAVSAGFKSKSQAIAGINRLLKIKISDFAELTESQAKTVEVALLKKKAKR